MKIIAIALLSLASVSIAAPPLLNHQGRIAINNVNHDGSAHFKFALVDATGTTTYWTNDATASGEPTTAININVDQGHYATLLGETNPLDPALFANCDDLRLRTWFSTDNLTFTQLTPDRRLTPAPYAIAAATATSLAPGYETGSGSQLAFQSVSGNELTLGATFTQSFATAPAVSLNTNWTVDSTSETGFTATASFVPQTIDPGGQTGSHASLATISGRPAVAYRDDDDGDLYFIRSTDASGTNWPASSITKVDGGINDVGQYASLTEVDGRPAIAYYDLTLGDLRFIRANDAAGTSWPTTPITIDGSSDNRGRYASLAVINGVPAISYQSPNSGEIHYAWAADAAGTNWPAANHVVIEGSIAAYRQHTSLTEINGRPAIAFYNLTDGDLRYTRFTGSDAAIPGDWTTINIDTAGDVGKNATLSTIGGNPTIAYEDSTNGAIKYVRSTDIDGTAWASSITIATNAGQPSLADLGGRPALSFYDTANGDLNLAVSADAIGGSWNAAITIDGASANVGAHSSLAMVAGLPAIAYQDASTFDLKFAALPIASWSASKGGAEPILASGVKDRGVTRAMLSDDVGTWTKSGDDLIHLNGKVGIGRLATANTLEVEGGASKTTAGAWAANSDRRIKTDIHPVSGALQTIARLNPVTFRYTPDYLAAHPSIENVPYYNVIAQEFREVFPDAVKWSGERLANGEKILQVDTYPASITAIAAVKELAEKNAELEARIAALEELIRQK